VEQPLRKKYREVHVSDVKNFLTCRQKWYFSSPLCLGLEPIVPNLNLWIGRCVHQALADFYRGVKGCEVLDKLVTTMEADIDAVHKMSVSEKFEAEMAAGVDLSVAMVRHYMIWSRHNDHYEVLEVEKTFHVVLPIAARVMLAGTIDLLVKQPNGRLCIVDHKTTGRMPNEQQVQLDTQASMYTYGVLLGPYAGQQIDFMFNFLYKREPAIPRVLQNGTLSRANLGDTTFEMYSRAIREHSLDATDYADVLYQLRQQPNKFFQRYNVPRSAVALKNFARGFLSVAMEMTSPVVSVYPMPDWFKCNMCEFKDPCQLVIEGVDPHVLLDSNYKKGGRVYELEA
jgi:CRISPR/Cas system-associated exonuclease Cas4 (RecB family)